jgi:hypothetical protein
MNRDHPLTSAIWDVTQKAAVFLSSQKSGLMPTPFQSFGYVHPFLQAAVADSALSAQPPNSSSYSTL